MSTSAWVSFLPPEVNADEPIDAPAERLRALPFPRMPEQIIAAAIAHGHEHGLELQRSRAASNPRRTGTRGTGTW
jgi:hypothetical protein